MNITRFEVVKAVKPDDLADFASALADATHYLIEALLLLSDRPDVDQKSQDLWAAYKVVLDYQEISDRVKAERGGN
jgi:hypothetical protein